MTIYSVLEKTGVFTFPSATTQNEPSSDALRMTRFDNRGFETNPVSRKLQQFQHSVSEYRRE